MARLNIEEKWKADPRRTALVKRIGSRNADGMLVEIGWMVHAHKGQPIKMSEFCFVENFQDWIDCGLGIVVGDAVEIEGSKQYRDYYDKQRENGQKGAEHGHKGGRPPKNPQKTPRNGQKPPSYSSSFSSSKKNTNTAPVEISSHENLWAEIPSKTKSSWLTLYKSEEEIYHEVVRAFEWYTNHPKKRPQTMRGWVTAISSWLDRTWQRRKAAEAPNYDSFSGLADV
jgi:hypothetical protein